MQKRINWLQTPGRQMFFAQVRNAQHLNLMNSPLVVGASQTMETFCPLDRLAGKHAFPAFALGSRVPVSVFQPHMDTLCIYSLIPLPLRRGTLGVPVFHLLKFPHWLVSVLLITFPEL